MKDKHCEKGLREPCKERQAGRRGGVESEPPSGILSISDDEVGAPPALFTQEHGGTGRA